MKRNELIELINQKESTTLEFKQTDTLGDSKEIAIQMVAFANLYGGKILFGIKNDGTFEGAKIDFDKEVNKIANIAKDKCSPIINFECSFFESKKSDVLIVNVYPRIDIPHAYIKRKHHEINYRVYYIRTSDGTRLVSDDELKWIFERKTYNIKDKFMICLFLGIGNTNDSTEYPKLNAKSEIFGVSSNAQLFYQELFDLLSTEDTTNLLKDNGLGLALFLFEILPLLMLKGLSRFFEKTWFIEIVSIEKAIRIIERSLNLDNLFLKSNDIDFPKKILSYNKINFRLDEYLKRNEFNLALPVNTKIEMKFNWDNETNKYQIKITISKKDSFKFNIILYLRNYNFLKETTVRNELFPVNKFFTNIECHFNGDLIFPFKENKNLEIFFEYGKTLLKLLKRDWDIDYTEDHKNLPILINIESRVIALEETFNKFFDISQKQLNLFKEQLHEYRKLYDMYLTNISKKQKEENG